MPVRSVSLCCRVVLLAGVLGCCSCANPGIRGAESRIVTPTRWQAGTGSKTSQGALDTAELKRWWERFRDPTLNELIAQALRSSPDIRTALSKIAESRARKGVEFSGFFPSITASGSGVSSRQENRVASTLTQSESYSAGLDASWQLDLFGQQRQNFKAASADLAQATENFYGAQVSLAAEVAEAYVDLREAEAQLAVVESSLASRTSTVDITRWREEAGQGGALDTQQALSTLEQARATIPTLKQTIAQTRNRLALLSGRTPGSLDSLLVKKRSVPTAPDRLAVGIPAETLRQRPDVRASERAVQAAAARRKSAEREWFPKLNLSGTIGLEALKAGRLFSPEMIASSLLGNLTAPIFDGARIQQNIRIQSEQEKQALIAYESTVLRALSEVENALIAVQRTAERLSLLGNAITAARQAATLAGQQYQAGQVDLLVVLEAERTLLSLEEQQVTTQSSQASAHIQLYKALGGGWASF